jgi:hypothetical protein
VQIGDTMLWWIAEGSDGIPPGIKYGYLELSTERVNVGDQAYSFWQNPVDQFDLGTTLLHSFGAATVVGSVPGDAPPKFFTSYDIFAVPGASGSSVIGTGKHRHQIIGVTAVVKTGGFKKLGVFAGIFYKLGVFAGKKSRVDSNS